MCVERGEGLRQLRKGCDGEGLGWFGRGCLWLGMYVLGGGVQQGSVCGGDEVEGQR